MSSSVSDKPRWLANSKASRVHSMSQQVMKMVGASEQLGNSHTIRQYGEFPSTRSTLVSAPVSRRLHAHNEHACASCHQTRRSVLPEDGARPSGAVK